MTDAQSGARHSKEWDATAYHLVSEPQFRWGLRVLERLPLGGDERVLDAGCGSGRLTSALAERLPRGYLVGCDLSENMTRIAKQSLGAAPSRVVVCADLLALPLAGTFDVVFSTATFHWVRDHDRLFGELRRVLRAGGRMEAQCGGGPNLARIHARANAIAARSQFQRYFLDWDGPWLFANPDETEARLRRAGFQEAHCWLEQAPTPFPDRETFRAFVEPVVMRPYLARVPDPELRREFLETVVEESAADNPPFTLDYWRLNISAATV